MLFGSKANPIHSVFCGFSSSFIPTITDSSGFKWPDDFETEVNNIDVGKSEFQLILNFENEFCVYNHQGNLYPYSKPRILERNYKIKKEIIVSKFGTRNIFREDNVFLLETGFNRGNVEFLIFDYNNEKNNYEGFRKVIYEFPLFWLINRLVELKKQCLRKCFGLEDKEKLEQKKLLSHSNLKEWKLEERYTSPSKDVYSEIVEFPLEDFYFSNKFVNIWLNLEFFTTNE